MKKTVEVSIMGHKFQVRTDSEDTYVKDVAAFVDKKINGILGVTKAASSVNVVILAAMNIADEYMRMKLTGKPEKTEKVGQGEKSEKHPKVQDVRKRIKGLIDLIEKECEIN